jgi:TonB family protein
MRGAVVGSGAAHVAVLALLFAVRSGSRLIVPGPDVVQVALIDPGALAPPPAPAAPARVEQPVALPPTDAVGIKLAPPKVRKKSVEKQKAAEEPPPPAELPYAAAGPAGLKGQVAVDAGNFEFTYYLLLVRNRVASGWSPPTGLMSGGQPVRAVVYFRVSRDGGVSAIRLESASGVEFFDRSALRAIALSAPLPPLPLGFAGSDLGIHFGFEYAAP